ncbi:MAG: transposase [Lachnospiraceae bacterium]
MVLHTWGQQLNFHPHILHCCLSGDELTESGQLPEGAVGKMFRGKFMEKLKVYHEKGLLSLNGKCTRLRNHYNWKEFIDSLYEKKWLPFIKETFNGNGNGNAITYLARHAYRTAISNSRITSVTDTNVTFCYKDFQEYVSADF